MKDKIAGVVVGLVVDNVDPEKLGRLKGLPTSPIMRDSALA